MLDFTSFFTCGNLGWGGGLRYLQVSLTRSSSLNAYNNNVIDQFLPAELSC